MLCWGDSTISCMFHENLVKKLVKLGMVQLEKICYQDAVE